MVESNLSILSLAFRAIMFKMKARVFINKQPFLPKNGVIIIIFINEKNILVIVLISISQFIIK